ncbi:hypothetical protein [Methylobacterium sp. ID0610]|uniref:hypothetical protein n=1 Tax=Methylobacterium carpenticola TaxID=3344827 RepID=UPI00369E9687
MMMRHMLPILVFAVSTGAALAQDAPNPYRYSGSHAGGPADALIPDGTPRPITHRAVTGPYEYAGSHAGGPADALIPDGTSAPTLRRVVDPAYRYSGSHAGGPADALIPE